MAGGKASLKAEDDQHDVFSAYSIAGTKRIKRDPQVFLPGRSKLSQCW